MAKVIKRSDVVNVTGGIETDDGRTLFGLDAEIYLKMKLKEDPEWERKVGEWIEDALGKSIEDTSDLFKSLKSGIILCQLINKIQPNTIKKYNNGHNLHVLMERENINLYLDACYRLGVPRDGLFVTSDLHSRRNMAGVLSNIRALSQIAPKFGNVKVSPLGSNTVNLDELKANKQPSKWNVPTNTGPIMASELEEGTLTVDEQLTNAQKALQAMTDKVQKLEISNNTLKKDVQNLREQLRSKSTDSGDSSSATPSTTPSDTPSVTEQNLRKDIAELKKQLESEKRKEQTQMSTIQNYQNEINLLKKQIASDADNNIKRRQMEQQQQNTSNNTQEIQSLRSENISLKKEMDELKSALEAQIKKFREMENQISAAKNQSVPSLQNQNRKTTDDNRESKLLVSKLEEEDQQQHMQLSILRGETEFQSLSPHYEEVDPIKLKNLTQYIGIIFDSNNKIEIEEVKEFEDIFDFDTGRRIFTHHLKTISENNGNKPIELDFNSYEALLYLFNKILAKLDLTNGADYISGKLVLELGGYFYRVVVEDSKRVEDYIGYRVKDHAIWQSLYFWEEYFWDTIAINFKDFMGDVGEESDYSEKEKLFLLKQLEIFSKKMMDSKKLAPEIIAEFISFMGDSIGIDKIQIQTIIVKVTKINSKLPLAKKKKREKPMRKQVAKEDKKKRVVPARVSSEIVMDRKEKKWEGEPLEKIKDKEKSDKSKEKVKKQQQQFIIPEKQDKKHSSSVSSSSAPPPMPSTPSPSTPPTPSRLPFSCGKCKQTFRFKYELNTHTCE